MGLKASSLEAPCLHDTNLNTLSTRTPRGRELLRHIKLRVANQMIAVFLFIAHEKGFKFHAQPQTGAYSCWTLHEQFPNKMNALSFFISNKSQKFW